MAQRKRSNAYYVRSILRQVWHHPSNRGHRLRAEVRAVAWQVRKRVRPVPVDLPFFGWTLRCHPDSNSASNVVYFTERYDASEMDFLCAYLRPGDGFVDVGANIGTYALLARTLVGAGGRVDAFEPHPVAAARARENVERNGITNVVVHEAAVGAAPGRAAFLADHDVSNRIAAPSESAEHTRDVEVVTLDDVLGGHSYAMGKLDVEGHETAALLGASGRLAAADPPVWQLEVFDHQLARAGTTREELLDVLARSGFDLVTWDPALGLADVPAGARPRSNVWAVHRDHRDGVAARLAGG